MAKSSSLPVALTIAGSDSGGGAGAQADLKTFAALGVHGASVITCVTAQNPSRVLAIEPCSIPMVRQQLEAVFALRPAAAKTGMLYSAEIIRAVTAFFRRHRDTPLVVDPVMIATSGRRLLKSNAIQLLREQLFPIASLVTPNLDEASSLLGGRLKSVDDLRAAAREIHRRFGCAALVKGGHLEDAKEAIDIFFDGRKELRLSAPFVRNVRTHGTGCTYSAAIAAYLAHGFEMRVAVAKAKRHVTRTILRNYRVAGYPVLNNF